MSHKLDGASFCYCAYVLAHLRSKRYLRGSDCKYRESVDRLKKSKILITCHLFIYLFAYSFICEKTYCLATISERKSEIILITMLQNNVMHLTHKLS